jgi:hypothetical protein
MKRGQISIEFLTIFGFVFLMTIPLIIIFFDQSGSVQDAIAENQIRNIAVKLADKAESIYYSGEPSKATIKAYFPDKIQNIDISSRSIIFYYLTATNLNHSIVTSTAVNISGNLSINPGIHYIELESSGGMVLIKDT